MNNIDIIAIIVGALLALGLLVVGVVAFIRATPERRREIINQILGALALEAERLYGSKTGQMKKKQVIAWFYERYKWLALFVSKDKLDVWIDDVVAAMNEWLQSNPVGAANLIGE